MEMGTSLLCRFFMDAVLYPRYFQASLLRVYWPQMRAWSPGEVTNLRLNFSQESKVRSAFGEPRAEGQITACFGELPQKYGSLHLLN